MGRICTRAGWKHIDRLFEAGSLVGLTDHQLLDRFLAGDSAEAAFESLVDRHGLMVRSVCRSMLRDPHEADDSFHATFLVLARRAGAIRRRDAVASWLFGVACRVAAHTRVDAARRRRLERDLAERASHETPTAQRPSEPMPEVLEELERLPERYRAAIVLCYLDGQSHEQAAQVLGCPLRIVQTRLQRGKARLRDRLVRRGLAPAAGLLAKGVESAEAAPIVLAGSMPAALSESTARASVQFTATHAGGLATTAIGLAQGVIRTFFWNRLRRAAAVVIGLATGLTLTLLTVAPAGQEPDRPAKTITGRILDDQGRPISGAEVWMPVWYEDKADRTSHATADTRGNYVLTPAIADGKLSVHAKVDQALPVRERPIGDVEVRSKQTTKLAIFLQTAVRVRGSIRVTVSHEPVAGASISVAYGLADGQEKAQHDGTSMSVSDAMGRFETYVMPGEAGMSVFGLPEPFVRLEGPAFVRIGRVADVAETVELPSIEVARGVTVKGRLIDAQDRPIADARVFVGSAVAITGRQGDFTMSGVPDGPQLTYRFNFEPQDKSSVVVAIVRENPLLLRAPIKTPK